MLPDVQVAEVLELLCCLDDHGVHYWLDGGWGVDCLLGEETRAHGDLDLALPRAEVDRVRQVLATRGYLVIRDWLPTSLALRDQKGREVDLHPLDMTADGGGDQILLDGSTWHYSPPVHGSIDGHVVRCASPEDQMLMHQGYEPRPVDVVDVHSIAQRFGIPVPASYRSFGPASRQEE